MRTVNDKVGDLDAWEIEWLFQIAPLTAKDLDGVETSVNDMWEALALSRLGTGLTLMAGMTRQQVEEQRAKALQGLAIPDEEHGRALKSLLSTHGARAIRLALRECQADRDWSLENLGREVRAASKFLAGWKRMKEQQHGRPS